MKTRRAIIVCFLLVLLVAATCLSQSVAAAAAQSPAPAPAAAPAPATSPATIDLSGLWKFSTDRNEIGQEQGWYRPDFDSSAWRTLTVPGTWEEQGITFANPTWPAQQPADGYNGYAWYRRSVVIPAAWTQEPVTLYLGAVDYSDWTYVNGTLVGSTPDEGDGEDTPREYPIPASLLRLGKPNVIAIQVLDRADKGGLTGPVKLRYGAPAVAVAEPEPEPEPTPQYQTAPTPPVPPSGPWHVVEDAVRRVRDWTLALVVLAFVVSLAVALFPQRLQAMARVLPVEPTRAALAGLAGTVLVPAAVIALTLALAFVLVILAFIVLVGWLVMPAAVIAYGLALAALPGIAALGFVAVCLALGQALLARTGRPDAHPVWPALLGLLLFWLVLFLVPVLGVLVWVTAGIFGLGLALITGVGSSERWSPRDLRRRRAEEGAEAPQPEESAVVPEEAPDAEARATAEEAAEANTPTLPGPDAGPEESLPPPGETRPTP